MKYNLFFEDEFGRMYVRSLITDMHMWNYYPNNFTTFKSEAMLLSLNELRVFLRISTAKKETYEILARLE